MKRASVILAIAALLLVAPVLQGFSQVHVASAQDPIKLVFWNYWDGTNGEKIQELVDRYNEEHPEVEIENVFVGWGELLPKLQLAVAGGDAPDLAAADMVWMPALANSGALVPLNAFIEASGTDTSDFYPALLSVNTYDDQIYGLPVSTNNLELFINTDLFEAAGLDASAPPATWDELAAAAAQCADPDSGVVGMELYTQPGEGLTWQFQVYLWGAGGDFLSEDLTQAAFNSEAGLQALNFWLSLIDSGAYTLSDWGLFGQGQACMVLDGSWMVGGMAESAPFNWTTAAMPAPADGQPATNMGGEHAFIMAQDEAKQQAAWDFINWLTSTDVQIEWDEATAFMPVRDSVATNEAYMSWINENEPRLLPFVDMQQYAHNRPPVEQYSELSDVFSAMIERALYGQMDPQEALDAAEAAVNSLLS
ncbi:ABC transporter substrate-binding protein [Aggregatilinea lenta]|uniref:ABC transporter substrate-binding protein n=1 Tax=Aggregatilinea lenta TaxID=913108 RepID=UPI000E5B42AB|nr:ABC transporter substrate-binding protein [Aggregatilinea lenta]